MRSNDSLNFPLGLIKYFVIVIAVVTTGSHSCNYNYFHPVPLVVIFFFFFFLSGDDQRVWATGDQNWIIMCL